VEPPEERRDPAAPLRLALDELLAEQLRSTREVIDARDGLWKLIEAVVGLASAELSLDSVLHRIVEVAREMVAAENVVLGMVTDDGLREFVHAGMDIEVARERHILQLEGLPSRPRPGGSSERDQGTDTVLSVPVEARGEVYGNLYLTNRHGGQGFTDDDVKLVKTLAAVAGVAIDHARLHEDALRREHWLEANRDLTAELVGGRDPRQVVALLVTRIRDLAGAATTKLVIPLGDDEQELLVEVADGLHADWLRDQRFSRVGSICGQVLQTGEAVVHVDVMQDGAPHEPLCAIGAYGPVMVLPLVARGQRLGTLSVAREKGQPSFSDDDVRLAEAFTAQAALALDYGDAQAERRRAAVYDERERIGHDLHDLVIQRLFGTGLALESVRGRVADPLVDERLNDAVDQIDAAIRELRSSIFGLHGRDGAAGLTRQIADICITAEALLGFPPDCRIDPAADATIPYELAPDLIAVIRETLTNVSRHAQASRVTVTLAVDDDAVRLDVVDDGRGIEPTGRRSGVANMRTRAERLTGTMDIGRAPEGGTYVTWTVPLR
jgi:signal transduction histidine kinase